MSGIIGSAGSKSGVIGETEIDYETGTWTPTFSNENGRHARYVKVGNWVHCWGWIKVTGSCGSKGGLPFTSMHNADSHDNAIGVGVVGYQSETGGQTWGILVDGNATSFNFRHGNTVMNLGNGAQAHFSLSYRVA
jgi:hypothetical protein